MANEDKVLIGKEKFDGVTTSVKTLRNELKELKNSLLTLEKGTDDYNKAMQKAANIQHQLKEQMTEINASAMDFGQIVGNVSSSMGGIVSGFQSAKAVMNLFGVESKEVTKSIQQMQNLMALSQGLLGIDNAIKAMKRLRLAMENGSKAAQMFSKALQPKTLLVITAAITALVAIWNKFGDSIKKSIPLIDTISNGIKSMKKNTEDLTEVQKEYNQQLKQANENYDKFIENQKVKLFNKEAKKEYDELGNSIEELTLKVAKYAATLGEGNDLDISQRKLLINDYNQASQELSKLLEQKEKLLNNPQSYDLSIDYWEKRIKQLEQEWNAINALNEKVKESQTYLDTEKKPITPPTLQEDEEDDDFDSYLQRQLERWQIYHSLIDTAEEQWQNQMLEENAFIEQMFNDRLLTEEQYNNAKKVLEEKEKQHTLQTVMDMVGAYAQATTSIGSSLGAIADLYVQANTKNGEVSEEVLERSKQMQIASTVIQTLGGIASMTQSVWSSPDTGEFWTKLAIQIAMTTEMLATMGVNIAQIKQTTLGNASGGGYSANSRAMYALQAPVQYTQDIQGSQIEKNIKNQRVYVLESDITDTQRKVNVQEKENTY